MRITRNETTTNLISNRMLALLFHAERLGVGRGLCPHLDPGLGHPVLPARPARAPRALDRLRDAIGAFPGDQPARRRAALPQRGRVAWPPFPAAAMRPRLSPPRTSLHRPRAAHHRQRCLAIALCLARPVGERHVGIPSACLRAIRVLLPGCEVKAVPTPHPLCLSFRSNRSATTRTNTQNAQAFIRGASCTGRFSWPPPVPTSRCFLFPRSTA